MTKNNQHTLVILSPGFPKDEADSTCLPFIQYFITGLNLQYPFLKVAIIAFDYPFVSATYQWKGNTVHSFNGYKKTKFRKLLKWFFIKRKLDELKRSSNLIGILSLWCGECAYVGNKYAKRNHLNHFCWILGQDAKKDNTYINRIKPSPEMLIAISDTIQNEFKKSHGISPVHTIPVGIDINQFPKEIYKRDIDVLGVGSLIPLKQYDVFIEAVNELKKGIPEIKAALCGKGPEEGRLSALIEKYKLHENIILPGELSHAEVLAQMKKSKIFLHTSNYEGFSAVCMEALYAGASVISFCRAMQKEIPHWHIVNTKEEMFAKAAELLSDNSLEDFPITTFTIQDTIKQIMQLFNYKEVANS